MLTDKINVDFQVIETFDPRYLLVADASEWGGIVERNAIIEIIIPGSQEVVTHYFDKASLNRYNSMLLGINCGDCVDCHDQFLPDGIYEITVKGSPSKHNKTRIFLKTTQAKLNLDRILIGKVTDCKAVDATILKAVAEIDLLIKAAEANVRFGNEHKAQELFFKVF